MLVLTRKENEAIVINGNIRVTILGTRGSQTRVGIDAPREISVHREEIENKIAAQEKENE